MAVTLEKAKGTMLEKPDSLGLVSVLEQQTVHCLLLFSSRSCRGTVFLQMSEDSSVESGHP